MCEQEGYDNHGVRVTDTAVVTWQKTVLLAHIISVAVEPSQMSPLLESRTLTGRGVERIWRTFLGIFGLGVLIVGINELPSWRAIGAVVFGLLLVFNLISAWATRNVWLVKVSTAAGYDEVAQYDTELVARDVRNAILAGMQHRQENS